MVSERDEDMTTHQVCDSMVKPWTRLDQCSLVHVISLRSVDLPHPEIRLQKEDSVRNIATLFVIHCWSYKFIDLINAIERYVENNGLLQNENFSIWLDIFCYSQWKPPITDTKLWLADSITCMNCIGHALLLIDIWENPIVLQRIWCLFEIYITAKANVHLELFDLNEDMKHIYPKLFIDDFDSLFEIYSDKIDISSSMSSRIDDKEMILRTIYDSTDGIAGMKNMIEKIIRKWFISGCINLLTAVCTTSVFMGETQRVSLLKTHHAYLLYKDGDHKEAEELCRIILSKCDMSYSIGMTKTQCFKTQQLLGNILIDAGKADVAENTLICVWRGLRSILGTERVDAISALRDLGRCYLVQGKCDQVILYDRYLINNLRINN